MSSQSILLSFAFLLGLTMCTRWATGAPGDEAALQPGPYWSAPDRAEKVSRLIPGRQLPELTPANLFAQWTRQQVERWNREHDALAPDEAFKKYRDADPADAVLVKDFPVHISPFGRLRKGKPGGDDVQNVMISYCPFCTSRSLSLAFGADNPWHAVTNCCKTDLYGKDWPDDYALKPTETVKFLHLDDRQVEVPCTVYTDRDGVVWELYIRTIFDHRRWLEIGSDRVVQYMNRFKQTADPVYVHKIALILDHVSDTYYGLPLSAKNRLATGKDGKPLTRAQWEASPRPNIFEVGPLGTWSRRKPLGSAGWLNMMKEHIWVEPFARMRHHPTFKAYSQQVHGDPEALDRKVRTKLLREIGMMFKSVFSQKLITNYQEANYIDLWLLGILLEDELLTDFARPNAEVTLYNHTYQDGLNGEGAPNYMSMPGGYFYPMLAREDGFLQYYPRFLEDHPFYHAANGEMRKLTTMRGMQIEFGDQHQHAFLRTFETDPAKYRENERRGSRNWAGYGIGILRVGGPGHRQEMTLAYTRASLHNAQDALSLGAWVDGVPVMRRGGYAAWWCNAPLQWERPEFQALKKMDYPSEIMEGPRSFDSWTWVFAHSPLCQNGVTVDTKGTGAGWKNDRGYGEVITFKGGEPHGEPGSEFQVLDVLDHYSWQQVKKPEVKHFRRTLIGVEGPDGRPYVLDLLAIRGGRDHTLYQNAWGQRAGDNLPAAKEKPGTLADALFGGKLPEDTPFYRIFPHVRKAEVLENPGAVWDLTWKTDMVRYAPRDVNGKPFRRPLPEDVGKVRLRLIGLDGMDDAGENDGIDTELIRGKGPWIGWMRQPLPGGRQVNGNVAFMDARDYLVERRQAREGETSLTSLFAHVIEGFREGGRSVIGKVERLKAQRLDGPERDVVAVKLTLTGGHTDTVLYQSEAGSVRLADGTTTDARYALLRRDAAGEIMTTSLVRGTFLRSGDNRFEAPGDFAGTIVDVIGDLTGTRRESALVIRPDKPWPAGEALKDRQLLVKFESALRNDCNEGYRLERVTPMEGGLVRVDVQDHAPFVVSWHQATVLPEDRPNVLRTNRPMVDHGNAPWYQGMTVWFPERRKEYVIKETNEVGGGFGGDYLTVVGDVNLAEDGIRVGDWYVIYGVRPGLRVSVAGDMTWRREPAGAWKQHTLRAPGEAVAATPATTRRLWTRTGGGPWTDHPEGRQRFASDGSGAAVQIVSDAPDWLVLQDDAAPALVELKLDDVKFSAEAAKDLGWIDPPKRLTAVFRDEANPIDPQSVVVLLNGREPTERKPDLVTRSFTDDGRTVTVTMDLKRWVAGESTGPMRHRVELSAADRSVDRLRTTVRVSFINKVPLEERATYLSDLKPVRSFAHGGLIKDLDYTANPAEIAGRFYPKCLTMCPGANPKGTHGQAVYEVPPLKDKARKIPVFRSDVGISSSSKGAGSAVFMVQVGETADGPWTTKYTSPVMRGGAEPKRVELSMKDVKFIRLYTTDADDGINSDHAVWGLARFE